MDKLEELAFYDCPVCGEASIEYGGKGHKHSCRFKKDIDMDQNKQISSATIIFMAGEQIDRGQNKR